MMHTITEITVTKKGRYALFLDGEFLFSVDDETMSLYKITVGLCVDDGWLTQVHEASSFKYAKQKALQALSRKEYTCAMLTQKLSEFVEPTFAAQAAERMVSLGLIDDRDYAMRFARDLVHLKHYAPFRVEQELKKRGLCEEDMQAALGQFDAHDFEKEIAAIIEKKYLRDLGDPKGKARALSGLARLGYGYHECNTVMNNMLEDEDYYR